MRCSTRNGAFNLTTFCESNPMDTLHPDAINKLWKHCTWEFDRLYHAAAADAAPRAGRAGQFTYGDTTSRIQE